MEKITLYEFESPDIKISMKVYFNEKIFLLKEIKNRFNENDAYSKFGNFMKENNIEFESFTWR